MLARPVTVLMPVSAQGGQFTGKLAAAADGSEQHRGLAVHGAVVGADPQEGD